MMKIMAESEPFQPQHAANAAHETRVTHQLDRQCSYKVCAERRLVTADIGIDRRQHTHTRRHDYTRDTVVLAER